MSDNPRISRRRFLAVGGGAALLGLGGAAGVAVSEAATTAAPRSPWWGPQPDRGLRDIAYCIVLENGNWVGPRRADGSIDPTLVDSLVSATRRYRAPQYLRYTEPNSHIGKEVPAAGTEEYALTRRLVDAGLKLGVAINVLLEPTTADVCATQPTTGPQKPGRCVRSFQSVLEQAAGIRRDSDRAGGIYDWIFLDFAWDRTPAGPYGLDDLQQMVDALRRIGWPRVMINASGFGPKHFPDMPQRTWAIAHRFQLFVGDDWQSAAQTAVARHAGAVQPADEQFVDYVLRHRRASCPVLKLEDPSESQRFAALSVGDQRALLQSWAQLGNEMKYRTIYPLFVDGDKPLGNQANQYDSQTAGTFSEQIALMRRYG